jgi:uncharacterized membrane protein YgcG
MAFDLPRLPAGGFSATSPDQQQIWWQQVVEAIEGHEAAQDDLIQQVSDQQTELTAAVLRLNIGLGYTAPSLVATATDAGTDATITIAAHTRIYADGTQLAVGGTVFTALAYATNYGVYYDDPTLGDTTPPYQTTTNLAEAQNNYTNGRHFVATIKTPASGGTATSGGTTPPGSGGGTASGGGYTGGSGGGGAIP